MMSILERGAVRLQRPSTSRFSAARRAPSDLGLPNAIVPQIPAALFTQEGRFTLARIITHQSQPAALVPSEPSCYHIRILESHPGY